MKLLIALGVLGAGVYLASANGILIGRGSDGPLRIGHGIHGFALTPVDRPQFPDRARVEGEAIEVERVEPAFISPGLELVGPLAASPAGELCVGCPGPWPPPKDRPLTRLKTDDTVVYELRTTKPGMYYLHGLRYRYRRGIRRWEEIDNTQVCLHVAAEQPETSKCATDDRVEGFEGLADIGGPSDYGDGRLDDREERLEFTYEPGGALEMTLTISNRSGEDRRLERLALEHPQGWLQPQELEPLTIPAGGARQVRVRLPYGGDCKSLAPNAGALFDALEAGDDDIELSIPLTIRGAKTCDRG